jgi:light-harvesting protein B-800-850 alpha chain
MNQGKMWLVVNPGFGIPFFLATAAAVSLFVHYNILNHTTWVSAFFQGGKNKVVAAP